MICVIHYFSCSWGDFRMSGHAQLAQTGAPVIVVGGMTYPLGGWMLALAASLVCVGLVAVRFGFRRNLAAGQDAGAVVASRRHRK